MPVDAICEISLGKKSMAVLWEHIQSVRSRQLSPSAISSSCIYIIRAVEMESCSKCLTLQALLHRVMADTCENICICLMSKVASCSNATTSNCLLGAIAFVHAALPQWTGVQAGQLLPNACGRHTLRNCELAECLHHLQTVPGRHSKEVQLGCRVWECGVLELLVASNNNIHRHPATILGRALEQLHRLSPDQILQLQDSFTPDLTHLWGKLGQDREAHEDEALRLAKERRAGPVVEAIEALHARIDALHEEVCGGGSERWGVRVRARACVHVRV